MPGRVARQLVNLLWYSTALTIVLAALAVTLGREMLPRINLQGAALSRYASERMKADIRFENPRGQWVQLLPELSATSISIHTPEIDIRMNKVRMNIDVINSLMERTPVFDRLEINSASIQYRSTATSNNGTINLDETWRVVYALLRRNIQIQNVDIETDIRGHKTHVRLQDFRVEQALSNKKIFLRLLGEDGQEDLYATGTLSGNTFSRSTGNFYVKVADWPLQEWLPSTGDKLPPGLQTLRDAPWHISGELWVDWQGMQSVNSFADLQLNNYPAKDSLPEKMHTRLSGNWNSSQQQLVIHTLDMLQDNESLQLLENLQIDYEQNQWRLRTPLLKLDPLARIIPYLPQTSLQKLLGSLNPSGNLRNLDLTWDTDKPLMERMRLRANVDNLASGAWYGVPAFTGVNGYLDSGIGYGFIDVDSQHGFSMFYPGIYHHPLGFDRATGRVQWQWLPDEKTILVGSDFVSLSGADGEAHGNFLLHLPLPGATFIADMHLAIGLRNSQARFRDKYLPYILPESLLAWLKTSIGDAVIPDAGFIYRGALSGKEAFSRAVQFYANIHKGDVQFDPKWPRLDKLYGKILVDDGNTRVRTFTGKLYNTTVTDAFIEATPQEHGLLVTVNARAKGPAMDGTRILRETPLRKTVGTAFDNWEVTQGTVATSLQLAIPLLGAEQPPLQDVRCQLFDTSVTLKDLRLPVERTNGEMAYHSDTGLSASGLDAVLFDQPVSFQITSQKTDDDLGITIEGTGKAAVKKLAEWSRLTPMYMLAGDVDYKASLNLGPFGKQATNKIGTLVIDSNLKNVALPLPEPLAKKQGNVQPIKLTIDLLRNNQQDYRVQYNQQIDGALSMRNGALFAGTIEVADGIAQTPAAATLPETAGPLQIKGTLPYASLEAWTSFVSLYNALPKPADATATPFPEFTFRLGKVTWRDMAFPDTALKIIHTNNYWQLSFDGNRAKGTARFFDNASPPDNLLPDIALDTFRLDYDSTTNTPSSQADINFVDIPSFNLTIAHFVYNNMDIGNVRMRLDSTANALRFSNVFAFGPGYKIKAKEEDAEKSEGAEVIWRRNADGMDQSEFHGLLHMKEEQPALTHLGFDPFVRGENIYLSADITWPGSPLDMEMATLSGQVYTHGEYGKYLQAKPTATMHAINVIDIATWVRRLRLDFSDLTNDGISFDKYRGSLTFNNGILEFAEPLRVESPSSTIQMAGKAYLDTGLLDLKLTATLPVGNNATWIAAIAGGLPAAAGVYVISKVFSDQLESITSVSYTITGPMSDPEIEFDRIAPPRLDKKN